MSISDKIPSSLVFASNSLILIHGQLPLCRNPNPSKPTQFPEIYIESNLDLIRKAAIQSIHNILYITEKMQLFSLDELMHSAVDSFNPTLHDESPSDSIPPENTYGDFLP